MDHLGRYEILGELGRGAMGMVYRARDPKIDRIVALKTITVAGVTPADEEEYRQRFFREAQAAGKLSHGGLVTIYDVGEDEPTKTPFIVMEFIEGRTLEELGRGERLPAATALGLGKQIAEALDYAHARKIIHRDIKPANIIVTADGHAKITDFGIAKLALTQFTQPGQVLGTPAYMSPEQLSGGAVDGRSDLFSLGVILYWLLTGDKPFTGDTTTALSFKIAYQDPIPATQLNPALSPDYDHMLSRALAKDPARRYQRGRELAADLEDLLAGQPPRSRAAVAAAPEAERTVVGKSVGAPPAAVPKTLPLGTPVPPPFADVPEARRKRRWLLPVAAAALLLGLGGAGWWWIERSKSKPGPTEAGAGMQEPASPTAEPTAPAKRPAASSKDRSRGEVRESPGGKKEEPPPWAPAEGARRKAGQAEERTRAVPMAGLQLTGSHNFERATLYLSVDEQQVGEIRLSGKTMERRGATLGYGTISGSFPVRPGRRSIVIRIRAPHDDFDDTKYIHGDFEAGQTKTLEISLGKLGSIVGIGSLTRNLTLRWLD